MRTTKDTKETRTWGGLLSDGGSHARTLFLARHSRPRSTLPVLAILCISWSLLWPRVGLGSPASALREYKAGKYEQALKEYEQLLKRKSDDPRLHFNAGAAAYRNQQFEEAAKRFNATLASPDLKLQGLAYYNEGNALYHLGEQVPDPKKRTEAWEKALQDYQSTTKLNPQDKDAKFNYEFVKRKLEELKQQQQQSQQNKSDQKQNQDQQQKDQNQQKQNDQKNEDQQQQQARQDQKQDSPQQNEQAQQEKEEEQKEQQQQAANQAQEQKREQDCFHDRLFSCESSSFLLVIAKRDTPIRALNN